MAAKVKPIPDGYHTATPYLVVKGAAAALDFYKQAFGATELVRFPGPGGVLTHAEMQIGDSPIMLADEHPGMPYRSPLHYGGTPVRVALYVENVDTVFNRAVGAGAKVQRPLQDMYYGDRAGTVEDPYGHFWLIATHKEDVSMEDMKKRLAALPK
jgi:PhnB protein